MKFLYITHKDKDASQEAMTLINKHFDCKLVSVETDGMAINYVKINTDVDLVLSHLPMLEVVSVPIYSFIKAKSLNIPCILITKKSLPEILSIQGLESFAGDHYGNGHIQLPYELQHLSKLISNIFEKSSSVTNIELKKTFADKPNFKSSGLRKFNKHDLIFKVDDMANNFYIIQSGQVRLFNTVNSEEYDIEILKSGELVGEMAYFNEQGRKRNCSASAHTSCILIDISYVALGMSFRNLSPWFKILIKTLLKRLKKANETIKQLKSDISDEHH